MLERTVKENPLDDYFWLELAKRHWQHKNDLKKAIEKLYIALENPELPIPTKEKLVLFTVKLQKLAGNFEQA